MFCIKKEHQKINDTKSIKIIFTKNYRIYMNMGNIEFNYLNYLNSNNS